MSYEFALKPFAHQAETFDASADLAEYAILWEQGTGKTKLAIDNACYLYEQGAIDCVFVVAPNGVHLNWLTDEMPVHVPERLRPQVHGLVWQPNKTGTKWFKRAAEAALKHEGFTWFFFSYDGFMTKAGKDFAWRVLRRRRAFYVADEAHYIKTPSAKRTMSIVASGKYAPYRRILTGTPVATGPFDIFSQLKFLNEKFWHPHGFSNFRVFKHHFGEFFTRSECQQLNGYDPGFDRLLRYRNIDKLSEILAGVSSRVLKEDVLDLPPKLYSKRYVELSAAQAKAYETLKNEYEYELASGAIIDGQMALTRMLRLQQILCGFLPTEDEEEPVHLFDGKNPRLEIAMELLNGLNHQAIIWARFTRDVDQLMEKLGDRAVRYDGLVSPEQAQANKVAFQKGEAQFFVGKPQKGREGLTLNMAKTVLYYSNTFALIDRLQSEDRCHRIGQDTAVQYIDLVTPNTIDTHIVGSLRDKYDIAAQITGDQLKEWL